MSGHELILQHASWSNIWIMMTGAEAISQYSLVTAARNANEDEVINAQADVAAERPCIGMALDAIGIDSTGRIALFGFVTNASWSWTPGDTLYLSDTEGVIAAAAGTVRQEVGIALSATTILFAPKSIDLDT